MISDAPYQSEELVLSSGAGVIAGLIASGVMLAALDLISRTVPAVRDWPMRLADVVGVSSGHTPGGAVFLGLSVHAVLGGALGLLFAMCLQRIPTTAILAVGLFYGVLLWIVAGLLLRIVPSEQLQGAVRSLAFLGACAVYGVVLSIIAAVSTHRRRQELVVVRD